MQAPEKRGWDCTRHGVGSYNLTGVYDVMAEINDEKALVCFLRESEGG